MFEISLFNSSFNSYKSSELSKISKVKKILRVFHKPSIEFRREWTMYISSFLYALKNCFIVSEAERFLRFSFFEISTLTDTVPYFFLRKRFRKHGGGGGGGEKGQINRRKKTTL